MRHPLKQMRALVIVVVVALAVPTWAGAGAPVPLQPGQVERVSVATDGSEASNPFGDIQTQGIYRGMQAVISRDGRFVAWEDTATDLVPGDLNGVQDVFLRDRVLGLTERISISSTGVAGDGPSGQPSVSDDGRYVAFQSTAKNLTPLGSGNTSQVYLRDRVAGTTELVSTTPAGKVAGGFSNWPSLSSDGRTVAFQSRASDLVAGVGDGNGTDFDVFVRDLDAGVTRYGSASDGGAPANAFSDAAELSGDGRFLVYRSNATNVVPGAPPGRNIYVRDLAGGPSRNAHVSILGVNPNGWADLAAISDSGDVAAYMSNASNLVPNDTNAAGDIFVHDFRTGLTERISVTNAGEEANGYSWSPSLSADGRFVAFHSWATNLVDGDVNGQPDMFVHDRKTRATVLVSRSEDEQAAGISIQMRDFITADGRLVAFISTASNLVPDHNATSDVFVRDLGPELGIGGLVAARDGGAVDVAGWAAIQGVQSVGTTDPAGDAAVAEVGADITGVTLRYRPREGDLRATIDLASIPFVHQQGRNIAGMPGMMYVISFATDQTSGTFQLRATRLDPDSSGGPAFSIYRCAPGCARLAGARGGIATAGRAIEIGVRIADIGHPPHNGLPGLPVGISEGAVLKDVRAYSILGTAGRGSVSDALDEAELPDVALGIRSVRIGIAPEGADPAAVEYGTPVAHSGPYRFTGRVAGAGGPHRVWARACFAAGCATVSRALP